jgi:hypothetical protein
VTLLAELVQGFIQIQRSYQRWLDKIICKTEMKFWAVLGSRGCREKKLSAAISMQLFGWFIQLFVGKKIILKILNDISASTLKNYIV